MPEEAPNYRYEDLLKFFYGDEAMKKNRNQDLRDLVERQDKELVTLHVKLRDQEALIEGQKATIKKQQEQIVGLKQTVYTMSALLVEKPTSSVTLQLPVLGWKTQETA